MAAFDVSNAQCLRAFEIPLGPRTSHSLCGNPYSDYPIVARLHHLRPFAAWSTIKAVRGITRLQNGLEGVPVLGSEIPLKL